jgi:hypothetical protein
LLGALGVLLLAAGMSAYFFGRNDELAGGFFVLVGLVLSLLAAFYSHIDGMVELGLLKAPVVKARRAEKQIERGQLVAVHRVEDAGKALEETLSQYVSQVPTTDAGRNVLLVEDAVFTLATFASYEQALVHAEVARMCRPDFRPDLDLRATRPADAKRAYRMHRVPETDIRLWYRQRSETEPSTLYVVVIENTGEGR